MAYRETELGYLVRNNEREAKRRIRDALKRARGNVKAAAGALGVGYRTLKRWLAQLDPEGDGLPRQPRGWPRKAGNRPQAGP